MSLQRLINRPCTITRREESTERDRQGNEIPADEPSDAVCELQQASREEDGDEVSETTFKLYLLPDAELAAGDTVTVPGEGTFQVDGEPWRARNPRTRRVTHVEATVCRTAGPADLPIGGGS